MPYIKITLRNDFDVIYTQFIAIPSSDGLIGIVLPLPCQVTSLDLEFAGMEKDNATASRRTQTETETEAQTEADEIEESY